MLRSQIENLRGTLCKGVSRLGKDCDRCGGVDEGLNAFKSPCDLLLVGLRTKKALMGCVQPCSEVSTASENRLLIVERVSALPQCQGSELYFYSAAYACDDRFYSYVAQQLGF